MLLVATWKHNMQAANADHAESVCMLRMPAGWDRAVHGILGALDYWATEFTKLDKVRLVLGKSLSVG